MTGQISAATSRKKRHATFRLWFNTNDSQPCHSARVSWSGRWIHLRARREQRKRVTLRTLCAQGQMFVLELTTLGLL